MALFDAIFIFHIIFKWDKSSKIDLKKSTLEKKEFFRADLMHYHLVAQSFSPLLILAKSHYYTYLKRKKFPECPIS